MLQRGNTTRDIVGRDLGAAVDAHEDLALRGRDGDVQTRRTYSARVIQHRHPGGARRNLARAVGGPAVDDEDLHHIGVLLRVDGVEAGFQVLLLVEHRDRDRDGREGIRATARHGGVGNLVRGDITSDGDSCRLYSSRGASRRLVELMHQRSPVGPGPSGKR